MALKIRLQRHGAAHEPVYRLVVAESSSRRDGRCVEHIGTYKPKARGQEIELDIKLDRADYWLSVGAQPSDTARSLIKQAKKLGPAEAQPVAAAVEAQATETPPAESAAEAPASEPSTEG